MRVVGIDPGITATGLAMVTAPDTLVFTATLKAPLVEDVLAVVRHWAYQETEHVTSVVMQVPFEKDKPAPYWSKSAIAFGRHCWFCAELYRALYDAGYHVIRQLPMPNMGLKRPVGVWRVEWNWPKGKRVPSEHARDAAQIAREALRRINMEERTK